MRKIIIYIGLLIIGVPVFAQNDFTGLVKYKLFVSGSADNKTDSMTVVFDRERVLIILYLPDSNLVTQQKFIDDFGQKKSIRINEEKRTYQIDTLKEDLAFIFINTNKIGAALNNELCLRYKADLAKADKPSTTSAECLAAINFRNSFIHDYSFLGVQPLIIDNRIVMDFETVRADGSRPQVTVSYIKKLDNVDSYFDLWGYREIK